MKRRSSSQILLIEIMVAVLFFALCSTVLLRLFAGIHQQSEQAGMKNSVLFEARSVLESLNAADDPITYLQTEGWTEDENGQWVKQQTDCLLSLSVQQQTRPHGQMNTYQLIAETNGMMIVTINGAHYTPEEAE